MADATPVDGKSWPRKPDGTIDWVFVFEDEESGLIGLVLSANSPLALRACAEVIIQQLFSRDDDAMNIMRYMTAMDRLVPDGAPAADMAAMQSGVVELLMQVKNHREQQAGDFSRARKSTKAAAATGEEATKAPERRREKLAPAPKVFDAGLPGGPDAGDDGGEAAALSEAETMFINQFCDLLGQRFQVVGAGVLWQDGQKPPFVFSHDFAKRLEKLIRQVFAASIIESCEPIIAELEKQSPGERPEYLTALLSKPKTKATMETAWQKAWSEKFDIRKRPARPKDPGGAKGLIKGMTSAGKKEKAKRTKNWKRTKARIKRDNKSAEDLWAWLAAECDEYAPPREVDKDLFAALFALQIDALRQRINLVRAAVEDSGKIAAALDATDNIQELDLALIAVTFQSAQLFNTDNANPANLVEELARRGMLDRLSLASRFADWVPEL